MEIFFQFLQKSCRVYAIMEKILINLFNNKFFNKLKKSEFQNETLLKIKTIWNILLPDRLISYDINFFDIGEGFIAAL